MFETETVTIDGNTAAAYIAYAFTEVAAIYPITPSSQMAEMVDQWSSEHHVNIFGNRVRVIEMQSEGGAAGALHGSLQAGALTTTFTSSQGLLLMIPNMFKIAGELLPAVFHVSARSIASHALSIFGDHSDVYAARGTGFAVLSSGSVQEIMDLAAVAHLAAIRSRIPFMHFFDGFRTSHEVSRVSVIHYDELAELIDLDSLDSFRSRALNPNRPITRGSAQNPDIYFQGREISNGFYDALPDIVEYYMAGIAKLTGRQYGLFRYYGDPQAERIIIAMGSVTETIRETIDFLMQGSEKVGLIAVHLYRPFSARHLIAEIPSSVTKIAVLDRTKEPGSAGEPLYLDVKSAVMDNMKGTLVVGGRYGLGSKDTTPEQIIAVFDNLKLPEPKNDFTIGITDDVTFKSLQVKEDSYADPAGVFSAKFWGIGSDGTVGANKNSIKIIGENTDMYVQGYFAYDSKKSGSVTISHLRFGKRPVRSSYLVRRPDFVACHVPSYIFKYDILAGLKKGGVFLLNSMWDADEVKRKLPDKMKKYMADHGIRFYIINATAIAEKIGLGNRINTIMQSAFFKLADIVPFDKAGYEMKKAIMKTYDRKGDDVVSANYLAVEQGANALEKIEIPESWRMQEIYDEKIQDVPDFIRDVTIPMNRFQGDGLPLSAFRDRPDGTYPPGTAAYEKREIAVNVPEWQPDKCIQCNRCSFVCPHAVIRPFLLDEREAAGAPDSMILADARGREFEDLKYRIQVSVLDCTGCGNCAGVCPAKEKALLMKPLDSQRVEAAHWDYIRRNVSCKPYYISRTTVKGSQFSQPLFEYSGACAGCGETPYIKLVTQLFGDRLMIANATGCSSIYGASAPSTPYTVNAAGCGPAWANSLFEDNGEYGLGMKIGVEQIRRRIVELARTCISHEADSDLSRALNEWIAARHDPERSRESAVRLIPLLEGNMSNEASEILKLRDYLVKRSIWIIGGDGWAYDIGFGGLDHVLASGEDVNILVLDSEVYSNTGGQSSKATPASAVAKFANAGKRTMKKDLGMMAMAYGYVYVAQVAMGANPAQYIKALTEAEEYRGPSLVIAYCPCINHGILTGMGTSQEEERKAVEAGYWILYRFNPLLEKQGKNPFVLDSKEPDWNRFGEYLMGEVRFKSLRKGFPDIADKLYRAAERDARWKYNRYRLLSGVDLKGDR